MHRMHHYVAVIGLIAGATALAPRTTRADLIRDDATLAFPDVLAAAINGRIEYQYDEAAERGTLTLANTPWEIAGSETSSFPIVDQPGGLKYQAMTLTLDRDGNLLADGNNTYELYGKIDANGQTFEGLLLQGTPTDFGFLDLGGSSNPSLGLDTFDAEIDVTGGALAQYYGDTAYIEFTPLIESTFEGSFSNDFTALKPVSNIRSYESPEPFPIPEPTTIVVLLTGGAGLLYRRHQRRRRAA